RVRMLEDGNACSGPCDRIRVDSGSTCFNRAWLSGRHSTLAKSPGRKPQVVFRNGGFHFRPHGTPHYFHFLWRRLSIRKPSEPYRRGSKRDRNGLSAARLAPSGDAAGIEREFPEVRPIAACRISRDT